MRVSICAVGRRAAGVVKKEKVEGRKCERPRDGGCMRKAT